MIILILFHHHLIAVNFSVFVFVFLTCCAVYITVEHAMLLINMIIINK